MHILLTGSSGWLGRFLAPRLQQAGHHVIGLDIVAGEATDVVGSGADRALVERVFAGHGIEAVIHAAVGLDETRGPLEPRNIYGVTKLAAEGLCRIYSREHGLNCAVLRTSRFF